MTVAVGLLVARAAQAQGPPPDVDPTTFAFRAGPVLFTPGLRIQELGVDDNVFQDPANPKRDYVVAFAPDLNVFTRTRFARVNLTSAADFRYYTKYESERSVGRQARARVDFLLSRIKPYVAAGLFNSFDRPNREIDARAEHLMADRTGGVYFEWSPQTHFFVDATQSKVDYRRGEVFRGVALDEALNMVTDTYSGGMVTAMTPLTMLTLRAGYGETRFRLKPIRNSFSRTASVRVFFGPEAVLRGEVDVGYKDFRTHEPRVQPYRGFVTTLRITAPVRDRGSFVLTGTRDVQFSYDEGQAYFVASDATATYTQRVFRALDVQAVAGRAWDDYGHREGLEPMAERIETYSGGVGYNLRDQSRLGVNYEYQRRVSTGEAGRAYIRRRVFTSWTYSF